LILAGIFASRALPLVIPGLTSTAGADLPRFGRGVVFAGWVTNALVAVALGLPCRAAPCCDCLRGLLRRGVKKREYFRCNRHPEAGRGVRDREMRSDASSLLITPRWRPESRENCRGAGRRDVSIPHHNQLLGDMSD
jgi:hypothetical protein